MVRDTAVAELAAVAEAAQRLAGECDQLGALRVPPGLDDLDGRRRGAALELDAVHQALDSADAAETDARRQLSAAPPRAPLERARDDHLALATALEELPRLEQLHLAATREREVAAAAVARASDHLRQVRIHRDRESRARPGRGAAPVARGGAALPGL